MRWPLVLVGCVLLSATRADDGIPPKAAGGGVAIGKEPGPKRVAVPAGWKEFVPTTKTYALWLPEKLAIARETASTSGAGQSAIQHNDFIALTPDALELGVQQLTYTPAAMAKNTKADLETLFRDFYKDTGTVEAEQEVKAGASAGKEFRIAKEKQVVRIRVFVIEAQVFVLRVIGTKEQATSNTADTFLNSFRPGTQAQARPIEPGRPGDPFKPPANRGPRIQGGGGQEFRDVTPPNGALVGFEVGLGKFINNDVVKAVRPIYRVGEKESLGEQYGTELTRVVKVVAKPGYAVGAIHVRSGLGLDGFSITFMKLTDGKVDPKDNYESEWIGGPGGGGPVQIGDGSLVVGVLLRGNEKEVSALGLIYSDTNKPNLDGAFPPGTPSKIQGGGGDREFRAAGPEGAHLVGLEIGLGRFFDKPIVKSVRPVFRTGDKDSAGEWHGPTDDNVVKEVVKVVAKPGYAVGAITVKTGLGLDGLSITFMKLVGGNLDPKDSYESEWVGGQGGGRPQKIGDGKPVIGLIGKERADTVSGLGLLFPPAKK
jgi:hypothetical protein